MEQTLHFEGRDFKPFGEFVPDAELVEGKIYFVVHCVDENMHVPEVRPLVFIGRDRPPGDAGQLYMRRRD